MIESGQGKIIQRVVKLVKQLAQKEGLLSRTQSKKQYHSVRTSPQRTQREPKPEADIAAPDEGCRNIEVKCSERGGAQRTIMELESLYQKYKGKYKNSKKALSQLKC